MTDDDKDVVVVSRYCPTCKAQIKAWRLERIEGGFIERCIDCDGAGLTELRETIGRLQS